MIAATNPLVLSQLRRVWVPLPARMTNTDSFVVTLIEVLLFTLFSQSTGAWKQEVSPCDAGGAGGIPPQSASTRKIARSIFVVRQGARGARE